MSYGPPISRRTALASLIPMASVCRCASAGSNRFPIVTTSVDSAFGAAIDGIQGVLAAHSISAPILRMPEDEAALRQELNGAACPLAIAVGIDAVRSVSAVNGRIPLVATMTFRGDVEALRLQNGNEIRTAGAVWLDLSVPAVAAGLRSVFPQAAKLGVVHDLSLPHSVEAEQANALPSGVSVKTVPCGSASELISSIRALRGQVEFLICLPDSRLYNKTTVEPLILASIEHKVPLVGFSASFARAGAAVGIYPDFAEVGRQTAMLCERVLAPSAGAHDEFPRRTSIAVNERVLHLLGREFRPQEHSDVVVIR
jgi:ABC-type uncharacterized transport system substrate-binding protein